MKKILLATTYNDLAVPLFLTHQNLAQVDFEFYFFHEPLELIKTKLQDNDFDFIYVRDPFNVAFQSDHIKEQISIILENKKNSYLVDKIDGIEDVFLEDKWLQYQQYAEFMPTTKLLADSPESELQNVIYKKRISSRAKDIIFDRNLLPAGEEDQYIVQNQLNIITEYRVYAIFNQIQTIITQKMPTTRTTKVKVFNPEEISPELKDFSSHILSRNKFDLVGLDIAKTDSGLKLIEVNRSCQFNGYFRETGKNIAEIFIYKLLSN